MEAQKLRILERAHEGKLKKRSEATRFAVVEQTAQS